MTEIVGIASVQPILFGVLKMAWCDGFEAVVDLRPVLAEGKVFEFLREAPRRFDDVKLEGHGHYIYWLDSDGDEIELGSDSLRRRAVRQAEILRLVS